jgi:hypothetical protein
LEMITTTIIARNIRMRDATSAREADSLSQPVNLCAANRDEVERLPHSGFHQPIRESVRACRTTLPASPPLLSQTRERLIGEEERKRSLRTQIFAIVRACESPPQARSTARTGWNPGSVFRTDTPLTLGFRTRCQPFDKIIAGPGRLARQTCLTSTWVLPFIINQTL